MQHRPLVQLRITKYDPAHRDGSGRYTQEEWTANTNIGQNIGGHTLTTDEYLATESAISTVLFSLIKAHGHNMAVADFCYFDDAGQPLALEQQAPHAVIKQFVEHTHRSIQQSSHDKLQHVLSQIPIANAQSIPLHLIQDCIELCLREVLDLKLISNAGNTYVHFGWDYYTYFGTDSPVPDKLPEAHGVFIENFPSPYLSQ